jgi:hypothetical protein
MPELDFGLHSWPGYPAPVVASAVRRAAESAGGAGVGSVRVIEMSPFAAEVNVTVARNVSGVVTRAVECALERLRDPSLTRAAS